MAVFGEGIVELEKVGDFAEEFGVIGLEVGFIKQFDSGADDFEGLLARASFDFGEFSGNGGKVNGSGGDEALSFAEDFGRSLGGLVELPSAPGEENFGARTNGGKEEIGLLS